MKKKNNLPNKIPIFPLNNFIFFPQTTVPLNIFEPRYIEMINDSMKGERMIGMVQTKKTYKNSKPELYEVGCLGKITSFNEAEDGNYLIVLNGLCRFKIINESTNEKLYREFEVNFDKFENDFLNESEEIKFSDLQLIFKDLKTLFEKKGYIVNWKELEKQTLNQIINTLAMASPFSIEEKQILLETQNTILRKDKLKTILKTYTTDGLNNTTIQ